MALAVGDRWVLPSFRTFALQQWQPTASEDVANEESHEERFETPTMARQAVSWDVEHKLRWSTCVFVEDLAHLLEMPDAPLITAQLYVQRFYMMHSFADHDRFLLATAAVFLAGKMEEFAIKVRLVTECAMYLLHCAPQDRHQAAFAPQASSKSNDTSGARSTPRKRRSSPANGHAGGNQQEKSGSNTGDTLKSTGLNHNPEAANAKHLDCLNALLEVLDVGVIERTVTKVLVLERILLQTIAFDLGMPSPHALVLPVMDKLFALEAMHPSIPYPAIRDVAFVLVNDCIKAGLTLAFTAMELAVGAVYLACLYSGKVSDNVATAENGPWWSIWSLDEKVLHDVARTILYVYEDGKGDKHPGVPQRFAALWKTCAPNLHRPDLEFLQEHDKIVQQDK